MNVQALEQRFHRWIAEDLHALPLVTLDRLIALLLGIGFLLLRLPFQSRFPVNWDAVQFAMGIQNYNIAHHQPHPPGYIGYIFLGKLLNPLTGDPNASLTLLSVLSGAIAPAAFYYLAKRFMSRPTAALTSVAFGSSMIVWYYSEVALTYAVELAVILPLLALFYKVIHEKDYRSLVIGTLLLAVLGSLRQSALVLLIPLWIYVIWQFPWRERIRISAIFGVACAVWGIPLLWLAGGPIDYFHASQALAELVGSETSVLAFSLTGLAKNVALVAAGLLLGINVGLVVLVLATRRGVSWLTSLSRKDRFFFLLWSGPALATFLLGHTGQVGYVLIILPIPFIWLGIATVGLASWFNRERPHTNWGRLAPATALAVFAIVNVMGFFLLPRAVVMATPASIPLDTLQFDVSANDAHWQEVTHEIREYPDTATAILTTIGGPRVAGSFRQLSYQMPDYHIYGLGNDLSNGSFGVLFHSYEGESNYTIPGLEYSGRWLPLGESINYLLIPDQDIIDRIDTDGLLTYNIPLDGGGEIMVIVVDPDTALLFSPEGDKITFETHPPDDEAPQSDMLGADMLGG